MPRQRTGTLELRKNGWHARLTVSVSGKAQRRWVPLGTFDKGRAKRMVAKLVRELEAGRLVAEATQAARSPETIKVLASAWIDARKARGVQMAENEEGLFENHIFDEIGMMPAVDVRRADCKRVLDAAVAKGLGKESVGHVRRLLVRFFNSLEADEVIASNPMRLVAMPKVRADERPRTLLTDDELNTFFACEDVTDVEIKILVLFSRTLGGARSVEANRLQWGMIDTDTFASCRLLRAKTGKVQELEIPTVLRPFLRGWWERHGCPLAGPVFPVLRGPRKGEARGRTNYPVRFRRALLKAKVDRHELHHDTAYSRKTEWHSLRRTYVSAMATGGVNEQTAMALSHHADSKVHRRYQLAEIKAVPDAAISALKPAFSVESSHHVDDSSCGAQAPTKKGRNSRYFGAGHGIRTRDIKLGKSATTHDKAEIAPDQADPDPPDVDPDPPCFPERQNESSQVDNSEGAPKAVPVDGPPGPEGSLEAALAEASKAGRWDIVAALARELEARRLSASTNVVKLDARKARS